MYYTCRSFIGAVSDNNWSRYWENEPDDPLIASSKGHLFALLSLSNKSALIPQDNIASIGHKLTEKLNQIYFFDSETNIEVCLKQAVTDLCNQSSGDFDISLIVAVVHQNTFYACTYNSGNISIIRQNQISQILASKDQDITFVSGPLQDKDKFFFYNNDIIDLITWPKIKKILSLNKLELIEENLLPSLYSDKNEFFPAAAIIEIHQPEEESKKQEIEIPLKSHPKTPFFKKIFKPKNIIVSPHQLTQISKRRRLNLIIVFLSLLGLAASTYFGYQKNSQNKTESSFQSLKGDLEKKITDILAIKTINLDTASQLSLQAQLVLDKMKELEIHQDEVSKYQQTITSLLSQTGSSNAFQPDSFFDLSLIVSQPSFSKMILHQDKIYLLDNQKARIDSVDIFQKSIDNISMDDKIKQTQNIFINNNKVFAQNPDTIYQLSKNNWQAKINLKESQPDLNIIDIQSWNNAIYLLDSNTPSVWKFNPSADSFGSIQNWIKEDNFSNQATSIAINGKIWILKKDGTILSYLRGEEDPYKQNKEGDFKDTSNLLTTPDTNLLVFTDDSVIIYVYDKEGQSIAKYNLGDKKIHDICIHQSSNILFVLCHDQKIYKIAL
ncbi:hypothetical protein KKC08_05800 [Patescibacteria group bacterium]|nr:hypothetical protein [Patescibacteria group bacterium]MCG2702615.1 hypothetical protein [Candidatus Parcubacteria bacterium]MBU4265491.1 hypothetical protein [Patescibacteria group bacterium]MBU4390541.1 hypothetical protein [Patescibacteria group bacterium]MBU4397648.1 hypothetical protein [Patescibacteria group bacterium]